MVVTRRNILIPQGKDILRDTVNGGTMGLAVTLKKLLIGRAFTTERGRIKLFGQMDWVLFVARATALNFQSIAEKNGEEYLYQLGYEGGKDAAREMIKHMGIKPKGGWATQRAVLSMLDFIGFGRAEFVRSEIKPDGHHHIIIHVKDNPVIEHARNLFGSKSKVCNWYMGVYAAHGEMDLGIRNPRLKENRCLCKGDPYCEWESKQ